MNIQERINLVELVFKVDLKQKQRNRLITSLRLFITKNHPEISCYRIGKLFEMNDNNVSEYRKKVICENLKIRLESIKECLNKKDASLITKLKYPVSKTHPVEIVMEVLLKHDESYLNDKKVSLWNKRDWESFERLKLI